MLNEAHELHKTALKLCLKAFGDMNVQTAKHYGNLGRLYQSMKHFSVSILTVIFFYEICWNCPFQLFYINFGLHD